MAFPDQPCVDAATLHEMGFQRAVALDGGMKAWRETGYAVKQGREP